MPAARAKNKDDPIKWKVWDTWNDALLFGALNDVFNLKEDARVGAALLKGDLEFIRKTTRKRLKACGVSKPKFKKQKNIGQAAMTEKGTRAYALKLYNEKMFGKPKRVKTEKRQIKKAKPKPRPKAPRELSPVNHELPQERAYASAREMIGKGETLCYIYLDKTIKKGRIETMRFKAVFSKGKKKIVRPVPVLVKRPLKKKRPLKRNTDALLPAKKKTMKKA